MRANFRARRISVILITLTTLLVGYFSIAPDKSTQPANNNLSNDKPIDNNNDTPLALDILNTLEIKGRAPKTGYARTEFGNGWSIQDGCDTRNRILYRDLMNITVSDDCKILSGTLNDPYTGKIISFTRGQDTSQAVQIDHVVALSNAWQTGAQALSRAERTKLANDSLELLAVDGQANQQKSDGDAATWLPSNKAFRCQYIARQIAVKAKYNLWLTAPEKVAMERILDKCPTQKLPNE